MKREFIYTKFFQDSWHKMGLGEHHYTLLENLILSDPQSGDVIQGTGGARKLRIQLDQRGKRGGGRVIYVDIFEKEKTYFLFAYPKNVQADLTQEHKEKIKQMVDLIKKE